MLMALAIKRAHNLPPDLSYVSTLPDIYTKTENLCYLRLNSVSGSENHRFWCVQVALKRAGCVSRSQ